VGARGEGADEAEENRRPGVTKSRGRGPFARLALCIYIVAFLTGAIVMSFEMLESRHLGPYFGSGIYTWAALISTVLAALCVGYFLGGLLADRHPSPRVLGTTVTIGSVYLLLLPAFAGPVLQFFVWNIDDVRLPRPCTHKTRSDIRFDRKAAELPRGSEMTRGAMRYSPAVLGQRSRSYLSNACVSSHTQRTASPADSGLARPADWSAQAWIRSMSSSFTAASCMA
jgi:hypothetical protein